MTRAESLSNSAAANAATTTANTSGDSASHKQAAALHIIASKSHELSGDNDLAKFHAQRGCDHETAAYKLRETEAIKVGAPTAATVSAPENTALVTDSAQASAATVAAGLEAGNPHKDYFAAKATAKKASAAAEDASDTANASGKPEDHQAAAEAHVAAADSNKSAATASPYPGAAKQHQSMADRHMDMSKTHTDACQVDSKNGAAPAAVQAGGPGSGRKPSAEYNGAKEKAQESSTVANNFSQSKFGRESRGEHVSSTENHEAGVHHSDAAVSHREAMIAAGKDGNLDAVKEHAGRAVFHDKEANFQFKTAAEKSAMGAADAGAATGLQTTQPMNKSSKEIVAAAKAANERAEFCSLQAAERMAKNTVLLAAVAKLPVSLKAGGPGSGRRPNATISKINRVYTRTYGDSGQKKTYVEWTDSEGKTGRTEGDPESTHMKALADRGVREGLKHETEEWNAAASKQQASIEASMSGGGYSMNDLQNNVREMIQSLPMCNTPATVGSGPICSCWVSDLICPDGDDDNWTAIVQGADSKLYAVDFDVDEDGSVTIDGEPEEVQRTTDYEYINAILMMADKAGKTGMEAGGPGSGRHAGIVEQTPGSKDLTHYTGKEYADKLSERAAAATTKANASGDTYDHAEARSAHDSAATAQGKWGSEAKMKEHNAASTFHWGKVVDAMEKTPASASAAKTAAAIEASNTSLRKSAIADMATEAANQASVMASDDPSVITQEEAAQAHDDAYQAHKVAYQENMKAGANDLDLQHHLDQMQMHKSASGDINGAMKETLARADVPAEAIQALNTSIGDAIQSARSHAAAGQEIEAGDYPGHPFRGNQYGEGSGGKGMAAKASAKAHDATKSAESAPEHKAAAVLHRAAARAQAKKGNTDTAQYHQMMAQYHDSAATEKKSKAPVADRADAMMKSKLALKSSDKALKSDKPADHAEAAAKHKDAAAANKESGDSKKAEKHNKMAEHHHAMGLGRIPSLIERKKKKKKDDEKTEAADASAKAGLEAGDAAQTKTFEQAKECAMTAGDKANKASKTAMESESKEDHDEASNLHAVASTEHKVAAIRASADGNPVAQAYHKTMSENHKAMADTHSKAAEKMAAPLEDPDDMMGKDGKGKKKGDKDGANAADAGAAAGMQAGGPGSGRKPEELSKMADTATDQAEKQTARQEFRAKIEKMVHYANGHYYIGDYQPATMTGRYETREAAIAYQMGCYDMDGANAADAGAAKGLTAAATAEVPADMPSTNPAAMSVAADESSKKADESTAAADDSDDSKMHSKAGKMHDKAYAAHMDAYVAHAKADSDQTILDKHMSAMADHKDASNYHQSQANELDACMISRAAQIKGCFEELKASNWNVNLTDVATAFNAKNGTSITPDDVISALNAGAMSYDTTPYDQGYNANLDDENPYDDGTTEAEQWQSGYDASHTAEGGQDLDSRAAGSELNWDMALNASAKVCEWPLDAGASADSSATEAGSLMFFPAGTHTITPSQNGRPVTVCLDIGMDAAEAMEQQRKALTAKGKTPFFSIQHSSEEAAFWPSRFVFETRIDCTGKAATGVWADGFWSGSGKRVKEEKSYRSFSPTFFVSAVTNDPENPARVVCNVDARANMGAVENDPAFSGSMSPLWCSNAAPQLAANKLAVRECMNELQASGANPDMDSVRAALLSTKNIYVSEDELAQLLGN
jgi:hypothetical protein